MEVAVAARRGRRDPPAEPRVRRGAQRHRAGRVPAGSDYGYRLDGGPDRPDPVSRWRPHGVHGPTRVVDPAAFRWTDAGWRGLEMADLVIYELHVGHLHARRDVRRRDRAAARAPRPRRDRDRDHAGRGVPRRPQLGLRRRLALRGAEHLRRAGRAQAPGGRGPRAGLAVLLDVVYNHLGPEGNYLGEFGPYFSDRYRTAWGEGFNLDGPDSDEVRRYLVDNAVYWVTRVPPRRAAARRGGPDRGPEPGAPRRGARRGGARRRARRSAAARWSSPRSTPTTRAGSGRREAGGYGLDAHWSDDFHHAVHVALTGERTGYYADFSEPGAVAKVLGERYVNDGRYSPHRRRRHGRPAVDVPGRPVRGLRSRTTTRPATAPAASGSPRWSSPGALRLAAALLLLSPYVPLLFMGEEHGETNPFLYFVSHGDPALIEAVRKAGAASSRRSRGRGSSRSAGGGDLRGLAAPIGSGRESGGRRAAARAVPRPAAAAADRARAAPGARGGAGPQRRGRRDGWRCVTTGRATVLEAVFNCRPSAGSSPLDRSAAWSLVLSTDAPGYGGRARPLSPERSSRLPGHTAVLLRRRRA